MPVTTCPYCLTPTTLPDPWMHPGYTCPHCRASVSIAAPPAAPPPAPAAEPLDFNAEPAPQRVEYRNRTRAGEAAATGFGDAFGRVLGGFLANCLIAVFVLLVLAAVVVVVMRRYLPPA